MSKFHSRILVRVGAPFFYTSVLVVGLILSTSALARTKIDPLSRGPIPLSEKAEKTAREALRNSDLGTDEACHVSTMEMGITRPAIDELPKDVCQNRTNEIIYLNSKHTIVACLSQKTDFVAKVSAGSNGFGKEVQGNRKSPNGTYWLGVPRSSKKFGIFIPIGYPNMSEIARGFTGKDVGLHGPIRFLKCTPIASLAGNWTAGCLAMGRDSQVIELSNWILDHWPVKISMTAD